MSEYIFKVPEDQKKDAWVKSKEEYLEMYRRSIDNPQEFWGEIAEGFEWQTKWDRVLDYNYNVNSGPIKINWFVGGRTNITINCLDRHVAEHGDRVAIIWEGNDPSEDLKITYAELLKKVCQVANVLKAKGVKKHDRVSIYMPMIPELAITMLACARIGAIHSIVFGGFSAEALADRIVDSECKIVLTADGVYRGKKAVPLKANADRAIDICAKNHNHKVESCIVVKRTGQPIEMTEGRDYWWTDLVEAAAEECEPEMMDASDPLFILYTSGSTGKPKGVQHSVGGYMVYTATTFKYVFDYHDGDIWWCTADIGWVTGHSYIVYGPLANGGTSIMFEGIPTYPDPGRFWAVVDKWKVTQFYTAPTAIRALMKEGEKWIENYDLSSLKLLGSVGEPINPEAWMWYHKFIGKQNIPIVDTWWQTETGGVLITPLPFAIDQKPGSASFPFFGIEPAIVDEQGKELAGKTEGILVIKKPWPGQMTTVYGDHARFEQTYFQMYPGLYFAGDGCRRDEDGYYWITGRIDDVINVSGHRMGTAEVESALVSHHSVAEAAVVGFPHDIKGQGIYTYVVLKNDIEPTDELRKELIAHVRSEIGPIASPDKIQFSAGLPKTRSGKIMRRILRKIAANEFENLGDTSTLAEPAVVDQLIDGHKSLS